MIVQMVSGKLVTDNILTKIQSSKAEFDVTTDGLVSLNTNNVLKDIIKTTMTAKP